MLRNILFNMQGVHTRITLFRKSYWVFSFRLIFFLLTHGYCVIHATIVSDLLFSNTHFDFYRNNQRELKLLHDCQVFNA